MRLIGHDDRHGDGAKLAEVRKLGLKSLGSVEVVGWSRRPMAYHPLLYGRPRFSCSEFVLEIGRLN
jgi:hypothetical protein